MWGPHHFPAFNDHFWRGDLDAASACAEWLTGRMRFAGTYKALMSLMLGDMERSLDHFEAAAQQGGLFNTIARWASDVYLSDSLREALLVQPRWQDALAALGVGDADRRDLIAELQTLTPHTGIAVADDGTPTEVAPPQRTRD
jgi:hypothetical protein